MRSVTRRARLRRVTSSEPSSRASRAVPPQRWYRAAVRARVCLAVAAVHRRQPDGGGEEMAFGPGGPLVTARDAAATDEIKTIVEVRPERRHPLGRGQAVGVGSGESRGAGRDGVPEAGVGGG